MASPSASEIWAPLLPPPSLTMTYKSTQLGVVVGVAYADTAGTQVGFVFDTQLRNLNDLVRQGQLELWVVSAV